MSYRWRSIHSV